MRQFRSSHPAGTARLHSGQRMTPFRWAPQEPTKVATVSQFAAPRDGEASLWSACGSSPLGLPRARESGDSFAVRSPLGRQGLSLICVRRHAAAPPESNEGGDSFRFSQPPGTARPHSDLPMTSRRWAPQKQTKVATVSQFAAPRDGDLRMRSLRWTRQQPTKTATVSLFAAPKGRRGLILICV